MKLKIIPIALLAILFNNNVFAASDGDLDDTASVGTVDVNLTVNPLVRITDLTDVTLGAYDGDGVARTGGDSFCLYRNYGVAPQDVNLTITSSTGGATISDGTDSIAFTLTADNDDDASDGAADAVTLGAALAYTPSNVAGCGVTDNGSIFVSVASGAMDAVEAGAYSATLTLTVAPI